MTHHLVTYIVSYNRKALEQNQKKHNPWNHHPVVLHNHWGKTEPLKYNVWIKGGFPAHLLFSPKFFFSNIQQHFNPLTNSVAWTASVSSPNDMVTNSLWPTVKSSALSLCFFEVLILTAMKCWNTKGKKQNTRNEAISEEVWCVWSHLFFFFSGGDKSSWIESCQWFLK